MDCENCAYFWQDERYLDDHPRCYWAPRAPGEKAPCDEDEPEEPYDEPILDE